MTAVSNPELETEVLKALMYENSPHSETLIEAMELLDIECFTAYEKKVVFTEMIKLYSKGESISAADLIMPVSATDESLIGFLVQGLGDRYTSASLVPWSKKLCELRDKRKYKEILEKSIQELDSLPDNEACLDIINSIPDKLIVVQNNNPLSDRGVYTAKECFDSYKESLISSKNRVITGLRDLDAILGGGFRKGALIAIGAPPSAGKTQLATKLCCSIAYSYPEKQVLIFSMEMNKDSITEKMLEHISGAPIKNMMENEIDFYGDKYSKSNIHTCDKSPVSVEYIRSVCKRAYLKGEISVVMVDYLDRVKKTGASNLRTDEALAAINIGLADLAKDFGCIVILLTQLNKAAINKANKRPSMNDSKNTNGTAESADYWFGIKRIGQWHIDKNYADSNLVEFILDKNRYGKQGIVYFKLKHGYIYEDIDQELALALVRDGDLERKKEEEEIKKNSAKYKQEDFEF